jgi:uncharacterized membrane protein YccC
MAHAFRSAISPLNRPNLIHATRTAVAAVVSWYVARLFRLPEAYWSTVTTIVIMQSTLGAAVKVSFQRFAGTAVGAAAGGLLGFYYEGSMVAFGAAVFGLGLLCALVRLDRSTYRFAGITVAIVLLIPSDRPAWLTASFFEVVVGIVAGLVLTALWPGKQAEQVV